MSIIIELLGEPKGKGRPRFVRSTGHAFTPQPTRNYEAALRYSAQMAMRDLPMFDGPLQVEIFAGFSVPQSWSEKKKQEALVGLIKPTGRPDVDNLMKTIDSLNGVVFRDDAQIVSAKIKKRYTDRPRMVIQVERAIG